MRECITIRVAIHIAGYTNTCIIISTVYTHVQYTKIDMQKVRIIELSKKIHASRG